MLLRFDVGVLCTLPQAALQSHISYQETARRGGIAHFLAALGFSRIRLKARLRCPISI
jgi:hypothetical protein